MGSRELWTRVKLTEAFFATHCNISTTFKMSEAEAQDAFIIFDEAYEGNDVDAFYLVDILRALGCNVTNAAVAAHGGTEELGQKRIAFADFGAILTAVKGDLSSTGVKEDYIEGLKVFDKEGSGKVPLPEVQNVLCSLGEKLEQNEATKLSSFSALSLMRRTTSATWSSLTSSSPLPPKSLLDFTPSPNFRNFQETEKKDQWNCKGASRGERKKAPSTPSGAADANLSNPDTLRTRNMGTKFSVSL